MDRDDLDDLLNDRKAETEERFRELEREAEIERLKSRARGSSAEPGGASRPGGSPSEAGRRPTGTAANDPLADLKAAVNGAEVERYLLVECPHCQGKNRVALSRLRRGSDPSAAPRPVCGRCKKDLSFIKA